MNAAVRIPIAKAMDAVVTVLRIIERWEIFQIVIKRRLITVIHLKNAGGNALLRFFFFTKSLLFGAFLAHTAILAIVLSETQIKFSPLEQRMDELSNLPMDKT